MSIGLTSTVVYAQETYDVKKIEELSQQGLYFYNSGNYKQALEIAEELLVLHTKIDDDVGIAGIHNNIGNVLRQMDQLDAALESYQKALGTYTALGDDVSIAGIHHNIGIVLEKKGQLDAALESYQKALGTYTALGDDVSIARIHNNIGIVLYEKGQLDAALESYQKALGTFTALGDDVGIAVVESAIETIYSKTNQTNPKIPTIGNTSPELTMPDGLVSLDATTPEGAVYNFKATAYDKEDGKLKPNCTHEPGLFPIGKTPVDCSVMDKDDNKVEGGFTVIVEKYVPIPDDDFEKWIPVIVAIVTAIGSIAGAIAVKKRKQQKEESSKGDMSSGSW